MPFTDRLNVILDWLQQNHDLLAILTVGSAITFVATLVFIPWAIIQLPHDYFSNSDSDRYSPFGDHPVAIMVIDIIRNVLGFSLICLGCLLLVLPGQGVITIIVGFVLMRFPGKRKMVRWLVQRASVHQSMNWIRRKANKKEFELE